MYTNTYIKWSPKPFVVSFFFFFQFSTELWSKQLLINTAWHASSRQRGVPIKTAQVKRQKSTGINSNKYVANFRLSSIRYILIKVWIFLISWLNARTATLTINRCICKPYRFLFTVSSASVQLFFFLIFFSFFCFFIRFKYLPIISTAPIFVFYFIFFVRTKFCTPLPRLLKTRRFI